MIMMMMTIVFFFLQVLYLPGSTQAKLELKRVTMLKRICLARPVRAAGTPASKSACADLTMVNCHTPCMRDIVPSLITMILVVMMIVVVFSSAALAASS